MADIKQGIVIKATDQFSKVLGSLSRKIDTASRSTQAAQTRFNNFTNATQGVSSALKKMALVGGVAIGALTAMSTKSGSSFEKAKASFEALTGLGGKNLELVSKSALNSSKLFGSSASEILDGTRALASAKSELMNPAAVGSLNNIMKSVLTLSEVADISATSATESLVTALNTFGQSEKKPAEMAEWTATALDKMAYAAKIGKMPVQQLTMALGRSAGAMQGAGLSFEESLGALQIGALTGLKPSMVGRQMKNIVIRMKKANKSMGDEGFKFTEILAKLGDKGLGITELTKSIGAENVLVLKSLIDYNATGAKFAKAIENDSAGAAAIMFEKKTNHLVFHVNRLWRTIESKLIKVYDVLLGPILRKTVNQLVRFTEWITSGSLGANALAIALGGLVVTFTALFTIVSSVFALATIIMWGSMVKSTLIATASVLEATFIGTAIKGFAIKIPASILVSIAHLKLFSANVWASLIKTRSLAGGFRLVGNAVKWMGVKLAVAGRTAMASFSKIPAFIIASIAWIKGATIATWAWATASWGAVKPMLLIGAKFAIIGALVFAAGYAIGSVIAKLTGLKPVNPFSMEGIQAMEDILKAFTDFFEGNKNNPILNAFMEDVTGAHKLTDTEKQTARIAQRTKAVRAWRAGGMSEDLIKENSIRIFNNINVKGNEVTTKSTSDSSKVTETTKSTSQVGSGMMTVGGYDMFAQQN